MEGDGDGESVDDGADSPSSSLPLPLVVPLHALQKLPWARSATPSKLPRDRAVAARWLKSSSRYPTSPQSAAVISAVLDKQRDDAAASREAVNRGSAAAAEDVLLKLTPRDRLPEPEPEDEE